MDCQPGRVRMFRPLPSPSFPGASLPGRGCAIGAAPPQRPLQSRSRMPHRERRPNSGRRSGMVYRMERRGLHRGYWLATPRLAGIVCTAVITTGAGEVRRATARLVAVTSGGTHGAGQVGLIGAALLVGGAGLAKAQTGALAFFLLFVLGRSGANRSQAGRANQGGAERQPPGEAIEMQSVHDLLHIATACR